MVISVFQDTITFLLLLFKIVRKVIHAVKLDLLQTVTQRREALIIITLNIEKECARILLEVMLSLTVYFTLQRQCAAKEEKAASDEVEGI